MRVACPNCSAEYGLPSAVVARLDGARTVRCARCGTTWAPAPPAAGPSPASLAAEPPRDVPRPMPAPEPPDAAPLPLAEVPPPPPAASFPIAPPSAPPSAVEGPRVVLAWTLSLALLAAVAWAAWHFRVEVMAAWPPSIRAYAALGLAG